MQRFSSNSLMKKKSLMVVLGVLVLGLISIVAFYLVNQNNLGGEDASAGQVKIVTLDAFVLKLELVKENQFLSTFQQNNQWRYTITGKVNSCYTNIELSDKDDLAQFDTAIKPSKIEAKYFSLNLTGTDCANDVSTNTMQDVVKTGTILAKKNAPLRFIVSYIQAPDSKNTFASTVVEGTKNRGFQLSSTYNLNEKVGSSKLWANQLTGNLLTCYTPSTFITTVRNPSIANSKATDSTSLYTGTRVLKLQKKSDKLVPCDSRKFTALNIKQGSNKGKSSDYSPRFILRYVALDTLSTVNAPAKTITKDGLTLKYAYVGDNMWDYQVTGLVPSSCYSLAETATVTGTDTSTIKIDTKVVEVKDPTLCTASSRGVQSVVYGSVEASSKSSFVLNSTNTGEVKK